MASNAVACHGATARLRKIVARSHRPAAAPSVVIISGLWKVMRSPQLTELKGPSSIRSHQLTSVDRSQPVAMVGSARPTVIVGRWAEEATAEAAAPMSPEPGSGWVEAMG